MKGYPKWFNGNLVTLIFSILFLSGILLIPTTIEMRLEWPVIWRLEAESRLVIAALHAVFAFFVFGLLGALWSIHMRYEWKRDHNRKSAVALLIVLAILFITGIGIYYVGHETLALNSALAHSAVGLVLPIFYFWHILYKKIKR